MTRSVMRMTINGLRHYAAARIVKEYATRLNDKQISKENALSIFRDDVPKSERGKIATFDKPDKALNRFTYIHYGVPKVVEIQDPWVAAAIYGLADNDPKGWAQAIKASQSIGNFIRRSVTLTLAFQLKQVFIDAPSAAFITGVQKPMALMRKAWAALGKAMNTNKIIGVDLFEDYKNIPPQVQTILDKHEEDFMDGSYSGLLKAYNKLRKIGYTFEWYLDGIAYDLRKIGEIGKCEAEELNNQMPPPPEEIILSL